MSIFETIHFERRLENFCTDILVGIFGKEENYELLERFCTGVDFLNIPEAKEDKSLKIESQIYYKGISEDEDNSYIDIQISGERFLCFLEMKVGSNSLSVEQLEKYDEVLLRTSEEVKLKPYLKFCSRKKEKQNFITQSTSFTVTRWHNIYKLLKEFNNDSSEIINDFLLFLDSKNMSNRMLIEDKKIEANELSLNQSLKFLTKLEIVLNEIKQKIEEANIFTIRPNNEYLDLGQNRYGLHYQYLERKNPETSLFIGFSFNNDNINKVIWLWSNNFNLSKFKFNILESECYQERLLKEEKLENILNWFLENNVFKALIKSV